MSTKRYAGSKTSKTPVRRLSPTVRPTSSGDGPHVPDGAPMRQTHRPRPEESVISTAAKLEACRSFNKQAPVPDPDEPRTRLKMSAPFLRLTSRDQSPSMKTIGSELTRVVERSKADTITRGYPGPSGSTQSTTANGALPRPSCVPSGRVPRSSVNVTLASKGRQEVIVKAVIPRPCNAVIKPAVGIPATQTAAHALGVNNPSVSECCPGVPSKNERLPLRRPVKLTTANEPFPRPSCVPRGRVPRSPVNATLASKDRQKVIVKAVVPPSRNHKASVNIPATRTRVHAMGSRSSVKNPFASERRPGVPSTQGGGLSLYNSVMYPPVNWSPPPSPDLSSFPSQSWTVVISVDVKQSKPTTTVCSDETSVREAEESGGADMPDDCCAASKSVSTSPALSSFSTVVSTPPDPEMYVSGADNTLEIGSLRKEPSVEVSPTGCAAKIISRSRNGSTSTDTLAKIIQRSQASSPTKNSDAGSRAQMVVQSAIEIARNLFSRSQRVSQSVPETAAVGTNGTDVSRVRKLFVPPLEKNTASSNPMIQKEIETLRARKVAGGGVVDSYLKHLGSLSAMKIATKQSTPSPDRV